MARKALIVKAEKRKKAFLKSLSEGKKPAFPTRVYNRCQLCGRIHGYIRRFDMCRICLRENARSAKIMGLKKSSW